MADTPKEVAWLAFVISVASAGFSVWEMLDSRHTSRIVNRPFVAVTASLSGENDIVFELHAGGATAAMNISVSAFCSYETERRWDQDYVKRNPEAAVADDMYASYDQGDLMIPGMAKPFRCTAISPQRPPSALPPGRAVHTRFLRGKVPYVDVYGNLHTTNFCFYHPPLASSETFVLCPAFNVAD